MGAKRGGGGRMLGIYLSMLNSAADQEAFQALYERNKYKVFHAAQGIVKNKLWADYVVDCRQDYGWLLR